MSCGCRVVCPRLLSRLAPTLGHGDCVCVWRGEGVWACVEGGGYVGMCGGGRMCGCVWVCCRAT